MNVFMYEQEKSVHDALSLGHDAGHCSSLETRFFFSEVGVRGVGRIFNNAGDFPANSTGPKMGEGDHFLSPLFSLIRTLIGPLCSS